MTAASSHGAASRAPVYNGKERVPGLWQRTRADGSTAYEVQRRVEGRMKRIPLPDARTKAEALIDLQRLNVGLADGEVVIGDRTLTVRAVAESFLARERGVLGTRAPRTIDLYEQRLRSHVLPLVGSLKADDVTVQHVRQMIDRLAAKGFSGSLVKGCVAALSVVLRHGERDLGAVRRNPCRDLDRGDRPSNKRRTEPRYLSLAEVRLLLAKLSDESRPIVATLFFAGLRVSEALSLRVSDIDFGAQTLRVRGTKTEASDAVVPLLDDLADELRAHLARRPGIGDALLFSTASGQPVHRRNVLRAVQTAATRAGLNGEGREPVGLHDLRHSCAAYAFSVGLSAPEVARLLRHASTAVTLSTYAGISDTAVAGLGAKLAAGLGGA